MAKPPPTEIVKPLSDAERARSLKETLALAPDRSKLRVFGYGSLMWNPCFDVVARDKATLRDYHRDFSIWSVYARGTPDRPGLGFGLEEKPGSICEGILLTLPETTTDADLMPLWEREMWTGSYSAEWVSVSIDEVVVPALTFVVSPDHFQYAGGLTLAQKASYIATASGKYGPCHDYLADTVREMKVQGIEDADLDDLLEAVERLRAE
ncbi:MAG: cation transport protein ChaC [Paracoccaceae bacterium]|jgi:cation transport protein ChaC